MTVAFSNNSSIKPVCLRPCNSSAPKPLLHLLSNMASNAFFFIIFLFIVGSIMFLLGMAVDERPHALIDRANALNITPPAPLANHPVHN
ncbi:hypothetical protein SLA2020_198230 [Shorea laevis]